MQILKRCWCRKISDQPFTDADKSRLRWLCRRGTKELDTAMGTYLQHHFDAAALSEQHLFSQLLQEQDPEIMALLNAPDPNSPYHAIIRKIRDTLTADD